MAVREDLEKARNLAVYIQQQMKGIEIRIGTILKIDANPLDRDFRLLETTKAATVLLGEIRKLVKRDYRQWKRGNK